MDTNIPAELSLTPEELGALPPRVRNYITALELKVKEFNSSLSTAEDELRRKRFSYWNRSRY
jgi:hypothetical protein